MIEIIEVSSTHIRLGSSMINESWIKKDLEDNGGHFI
jgi:hypothetical protein